MIYVKKAWRLGQKQLLQSEILQNAQRLNPDQKGPENLKDQSKPEESKDLPAFTNDPLKVIVQTSCLLITGMCRHCSTGNCRVGLWKSR